MKYIILLAFLLINPVTQAEEVGQKSFFDGTKTIHLKFTNIIDGQYTVNVLWMPDDGLAPQLVGPATINFVKDKGHSFSVSAEAFHLPINVLNKFGLLRYDDSGDYHTLPVDLSQVHPIEYGSGEVSIFNNPYHLHYDKPIVGIVPFFFEDIDFDGKDELIIINTRAGQEHLRSKRELIEEFIDSHLMGIAVDDIDDEFEKFWDAAKVGEFGTLCEDEGLVEKEVRAVVETYLYDQRKPLADDIAKTLQTKPKLLERKKIIPRVLDKIMEHIEKFYEL